jgi:2-polyprenyl-3-methyl-5-hydroxy-6-metoxy-1,4-benzoquinol methylase
MDSLFINGLKPYEKDKYRFERAIKLMDNPQNKQIIEIGPYPGTGIYYFGESNKITGIGKSTRDFTHKVEKCGHTLLDIDFETDEIPIQYNESADIVLLMEVIEHIRFPWRFLKKIANLVCKGGKFLLTTNNASYIGYILKLLLGKPILDTIEMEEGFYPGHMRYYDLEELCGILEAMDFRITHRAYSNYLPRFFYYKNKYFGLAKNVLIKLMPDKYSTHIEIVAKKI